MQPHSGILTVIDFIDWLLLQDANERSERESENEPQRKNKWENSAMEREERYAPLKQMKLYPDQFMFMQTYRVTC